jgi:hypothetical protein
LPKNTNVTAIETRRRARADGHQRAPDGPGEPARLRNAEQAAELTGLACCQILTAGAPAALDHAPLRPLKVLSLLGA